MSKLLRLVLAISTGIARDQAQRRRVMFILLLAALSMLAAGTFPLCSFFATHPLAFAIYWLVCGWIVICVMLMAIYDLLVVLRRGREEHRAARRATFKDID